MAAILKVSCCVKIRFRQSMRIYKENNPAKFDPDPIWNDGALGLFWTVLPQQERQEKMTRLVAMCDWSVPDQKIDWILGRKKQTDRQKMAKISITRVTTHTCICTAYAGGDTVRTAGHSDQ